MLNFLASVLAKIGLGWLSEFLARRRDERRGEERERTKAMERDLEAAKRIAKGAQGTPPADRTELARRVRDGF